MLQPPFLSLLPLEYFEDKTNFKVFNSHTGIYVLFHSKIMNIMNKLTTQKQGRRILQTQRHLPVQLQITETTVRIPLWTYILIQHNSSGARVSKLHIIQCTFLRTFIK